jgi:hypothetical protein
MLASDQLGLIFQARLASPEPLKAKAVLGGCSGYGARRGL